MSQLQKKTKQTFPTEILANCVAIFLDTATHFFPSQGGIHCPIRSIERRPKTLSFRLRIEIATKKT